MEDHQLLLEFKDHLKVKNYSVMSISSIYAGVGLFLSWLQISHKDLKDLCRQDIITYHLYLKNKDYQPNSVQRFLHSLKSFLRYLSDIFYILTNPMDNYIIKRVPPKIPVVLTESEVKKILASPNTSTLSGLRDRAILEVLYSTGIRLNELVTVTIFDVDTDSGFLRVNQGKFSKDRFVPLTKPACACLKTYINKVRPCFTKNKLTEKSLFTGLRGRQIHKLTVSRLISDYAKAAGLKKKITAHTFRHTCATHLLNNGVDIFKLQKLLGHSRPSVTQRYTRITPDQVKKEHEEHHPREKKNRKKNRRRKKDE